MEKDVLTQSEAMHVVGGRPVWEELKQFYPNLLVPFRVKGTKEQYLLEVIRTAERAAQMDGKLRDPNRFATSES